jgi:hypothetical protein
MPWHKTLQTVQHDLTVKIQKYTWGTTAKMQHRQLYVQQQMEKITRREERVHHKLFLSATLWRCIGEWRYSSTHS